MTKRKAASSSRSKVNADDALIILDGVLDLDEAGEVVPFTYSITAYGADYPVDGLIKRLRAEDISVPRFSTSLSGAKPRVRFQREFVWKKQQSNRFIESLLLGLPVPGIFLVKEPDGKLLVLDGHQRLQTLRRYYDNDWEGKAYALEGVQDRFENRTYEQLESEDSRRLDDSIIHATVVRQDEPSEDMSSIYLVFERLNSGGTILQPQEIRVALYHGELVSLLTDLNSTRAWRALFGRKSRRLKDIELILRFFAMLESSRGYKRPMKGFLNAYMAKRRHIDAKQRDSLSVVFTRTTEAILRGIGSQAFKLKTAVNAALVDAVMVGVARRVLAGKVASPADFKKAYDELLSDQNFQGSIGRATADEESVKTRLGLATQRFKAVR